MVGLLALLAMGPSVRVSSFADLPVGDTITVTVKSQGCFHNTVTELVFRQGRALMVHGRAGDHSSGRATWRTSVPERAVLPAEQAKLDDLLAYYRAPLGDGCTTREKIELVQTRAGREIARERWADESCARKITRTSSGRTC